jgi:DNA processing protein
MGTLPDFNKELCISVVGTRNMSEYGMRAAYKIAYEIASAGAVVVSGMALGIDGIASCAAIAAKGKTLAVLGCGIDIVYPKEHSKLKEIIRQNGAVITEYPPATLPYGMNFPVRNRIISGLGQGTVVIDADVGSGAMITAKKAILQGRDVYAVPGNIDAQNTSGTNSLIRDGAQAVLCGADIIKNYSYMYRDSLNIQKMVNSEARSDFSSEVVRNMGVGMRTRDQRASNQSDVITLGYRAERKTPAIKKPDVKKVDGEEKVSIPIPVTEKKTETRSGDDSARVLESLNDRQRKVFEEMPLDRAVTVDYLTKTGFALGEVMSALTILEIKGLVSSLPGALYIRK